MALSQLTETLGVTCHSCWRRPASFTPSPPPNGEPTLAAMPGGTTPAGGSDKLSRFRLTPLLKLCG